jgi:HlyD family secretion protein
VIVFLRRGIMKKKRTWFILGIVALLVAGGVYLVTRPTASAESLLLANAQTAKVVRTTLSMSVQSSGSIIPEAKTQLSFGASGTVDKVAVVPGDKVKEGDVLATLDTTDLQLKVTQAEQAYLVQQLTYSNTVQPEESQIALAQASYNNALASYNAAKQSVDNQAEQLTVQCSQLTTAKNALDIAQTAYDRLANDHQAKNYLASDWGPFQSVVNNLTNAQTAYDQAVANCNISKTNINDSSLRSAQAQLQSAKSSLDSLISPNTETVIQAKAQLEQARLSLEQARINLANATLTAPFDGVITAVNIQPGDSSGSGDVIEMADVSKLHVDVLVDETQIATVKPGQNVDLTLDALSGITLTGQVARIDPVGVVSQGVVNYNVRVNLNPADASVPLRLDMTANADIIGETHQNVLAVPTTAIRTGFGGGGQGGFGGGQGGFGGQGGQGGANGQGSGNGQGGQGRSNIQGGQPITNPQSGRPITNTQGGQQRLQGSFVLVIENGQPTPVPVTEGLTVGDLTEVSGNLKEGDEVIVGTLARSTNTNPGARFGGGGFFGGGGRFPGD